MLKKHLKHRAIIVYLAVLAFMISCQDIFEKDLSQEQVTLLAPSNFLETEIVTQTFWWEELEGALNYNLQIVSPSFATTQSVVLDTVIETTSWTITLTPGIYQWRVKAMNGSSETDFTVHTLTVDTTSDLSQQVLLLSSPSDETYSNSLTQTFNWQSIYGAAGYEIQIASPDFNNATNIFLDSNITTSSFTYVLPGEADYQWKVRATNLNTQSPFSQVWDLYIDITSPNVPTLLLPNHGAFVSNPFTLYWDHGTVTGSPVRDSLYLYSDSLVTLVLKAEKSGTSHTDSLGMGQYFWRVRSVDEAGNVGGYSDIRKFNVQ